MTFKTDFEAVLADMLVEQATLLRATRTLDSTGRQTKNVKTEVTITCAIQPVSEKNWRVLNLGIPEQGTKVGYFKASYSQFSTDYVVDVGDEIKDRDGVLYRVEEIINKYKYNGVVVYIKARLERVV
jgi:hypothetical protein